MYVVCDVAIDAQAKKTWGGGGVAVIDARAATYSTGNILTERTI